MHCLSYYILFIPPCAVLCLVAQSCPAPDYMEDLKAELFVQFTATSPVFGAVLKQ